LWQLIGNVTNIWVGAAQHNNAFVGIKQVLSLPLIIINSQ